MYISQKIHECRVMARAHRFCTFLEKKLFGGEKVHFCALKRWWYYFGSKINPYCAQKAYILYKRLYIKNKL